MRRLILGLTVLSFLVSLVSCGPRGESKSLQEVFESAKRQYQGQNVNGLELEVSTALTSINGGLDKLLASTASEQNISTADVSQQGLKIAELLSAISKNCGFTVRPALGELISQYRSLGSAGNVSPGSVKLLASRTYQLLSSELETNRFRL